MRHDGCCIVRVAGLEPKQQRRPSSSMLATLSIDSLGCGALPLPRSQVRVGLVRGPGGCHAAPKPRRRPCGTGRTTHAPARPAPRPNALSRSHSHWVLIVVVKDARQHLDRARILPLAQTECNVVTEERAVVLEGCKA